MNWLMEHSSEEHKFSDSDFMFEAGDIGMSKSDCAICKWIIWIDIAYSYQVRFLIKCYEFY